MLAALLLALGAVGPVRNLDQRVSLMEARQMLQSQTLWTLQAAMPPDAAKAMQDLDLHLQEDRDRDEKLAHLETTVSELEQRLQSIELLLGDRTVGEGGPVRVAPAPAQVSTMILKVRPQAQAKAAKKKHGKAQSAAVAHASKASRTDRMSAQQP